MRIEMLVLEEGYRTYKSKGVEQKEYLFTGRDCNKNPGEGRCSNNLVLMATQDDLDKYKGKLQDEKIVVDVKTIAVDFSGNVRLTGKFEPIGKKAA